MTDFEIVSPYLIITDIANCSVCGGEHKNMHFYQFFDEWKSVCPASNGAAIYIKLESKQ